MRRRPTAILLAFSILALVEGGPAAAQSRREGGPLSNPTQVYRDLPGVKRQEDVVEPSYRCTSSVQPTHGYARRGRSFDADDLLADGLPVLVYRCTSGGATYEGTSQPRSPGWFPGINPQTLPDH